MKRVSQPKSSFMGVEYQPPNELIRPTQVVVDLEQIRRNYEAIQAHVGSTQVMAVVKANAYGHGLGPVAKSLAEMGVPYFGVAYVEEALVLRQQGISTPILVLGGLWPDQIPLYLQHDLTLTASSVEKLQAIDQVAAQMNTTARVHLKIDTGMERIGVHYYSAETLLAAALNCQHVYIEGIFTHFANSDVADLSHARTQIDRFQNVLNIYETWGIAPPPIRHMANSGGILQLPEANFDMVRAGILLYGVYPSPDAWRSVVVDPALTWKSQIVYFKVVKPHHPVSYGSTWQSDKLTRVVTVPAGYGDGYPRLLSNNGHVIINGRRYPIVGSICMDQFMVNIEWDSAYNGDEVILLGSASNGQAVTVEEIAARAQTIPYEVLTGIGPRVPRIYLHGVE